MSPMQRIIVFTLTKHRPKFGRISAYLRALEEEKKIYLFIYNTFIKSGHYLMGRGDRALR